MSSLDDILGTTTLSRGDTPTPSGDKKALMDYARALSAVPAPTMKSPGAALRIKRVRKYLRELSQVANDLK